MSASQRASSRAWQLPMLQLFSCSYRGCSRRVLAGVLESALLTVATMPLRQQSARCIVSRSCSHCARQRAYRAVPFSVLSRQPRPETITGTKPSRLRAQSRSAESLEPASCAQGAHSPFAVILYGSGDMQDMVRPQLTPRLSRTQSSFAEQDTELPCRGNPFPCTTLHA